MLVMVGLASLGAYIWKDAEDEIRVDCNYSETMSHTLRENHE